MADSESVAPAAASEVPLSVDAQRFSVEVHGVTHVDGRDTVFWQVLGEVHADRAESALRQVLGDELGAVREGMYRVFEVEKALVWVYMFRVGVRRVLDVQRWEPEMPFAGEADAL